MTAFVDLVDCLITLLAHAARLPAVLLSMALRSSRSSMLLARRASMRVSSDVFLPLPRLLAKDIVFIPS